MSAAAVLTAAAVASVVRLVASGTRPARARRRLRLRGRPAAGRVVAWLAPRLAAADLDRSVPEVLRALAALAVAAGLLGAGGGPLGAAAGPVVVVGGAAVALHLARDRRDQRRRRELPDLLEAVARSLRSGTTVPGALREAAGCGSLAAEDLMVCVGEVDAGAGWPAALAGWADRRPEPGVRLAVGALSVALGSGGAPARAVDGVAATLRDRDEVDRELRALATQARTSALVVTLAPLAFGLLGLVGDRRTAAFLLTTPAGLACVVAGLVLDVVGALWMRRLTGGAR